MNSQILGVNHGRQWSKNASFPILLPWQQRKSSHLSVNTLEELWLSWKVLGRWYGATERPLPEIFIFEPRSTMKRYEFWEIMGPIYNTLFGNIIGKEQIFHLLSKCFKSTSQLPYIMYPKEKWQRWMTWVSSHVYSKWGSSQSYTWYISYISCFSFAACLVKDIDRKEKSTIFMIITD